MKDHFEQSIKESLQGFEAPYNPAAWDAMRAQLDAKMPVKSAPKGGSSKWYIAAALVGTIGVGSYFLFSDDQAQVAVETPQEMPNTAETNSENATVSANSDATNSSTNNTTQQVTPDERQGNTATHTAQTTSGNPTQHSESNPSNERTNPVDEGNRRNNSAPQVNAGNNQPSVTENQPTKGIDVKLPVMNDVCQHSVVTIENTNKVPLLLTGPEVYQIIPAKETVKLRMKKAGDYLLREYNKENARQIEFEVKDAPVADFSIDPMTKFEGGLPTTKLTANVPGTHYEWVINGERLYGPEADAHFYRQGNHDVSLIVTGPNGCETLHTKSVYIEENYNLMAPSSLRPLSTDPAVNTFIPYALKERNVNFRMIIIDPADGHILFETKDAAIGWDGIDRKTGQLVQFDRLYIWKVTLDKPAKNEQRTEYSGQVIPVHTN